MTNTPDIWYVKVAISLSLSLSLFLSNDDQAASSFDRKAAKENMATWLAERVLDLIKVET